MLKRLDLIGFKSFADKTTFNFGDGITAIVGPNGSGKSNIVDAIRWILGEQSAKSLRGGEMADVIFNGSTSRRSFGFAEVSMTLDNAKRFLATDAAEVQVTRRVYRNGEGEYLINSQPSRLKDIKDLFLGSGAGHNAYSIIEQGKVDILLQASTKERRTLFEEAAGISRFKAKKIETLRKLEHVDQNLQRVQDIIDEVDKQLRTVKLQASKAERYQEYSTRLRELRIGLGLREYHELSEQLAAETTVLDQLRAELEGRAAASGDSEAQTQRLETQLGELEENLHRQEALLSRIREQIKSNEATLAHETHLSAELEGELARTRKRLTELTARLAGLRESYQKAHEEFLTGDAQARDQRRQVGALEEQLAATVTRLGDLHQQVEIDKAEHLEQMRNAAHRQNDAIAAKAQVDNLRREHSRLRQRSAQAAENLASVDVELQELTQAEQALQARVADARQSLVDLRREREQVHQEREQTSERVGQLRQQRSGLASRVELLQGLIKSHEGLGSGVRQVFALLEQPQPGPWSTVLGIIADFLTVRREHAPLIDLALGEWAQRFVVRDVEQLVTALRDRPEPFSGRVSFLPLPASVDAAAENESAADATNAGYHRPHVATVLRLGESDRAVEVSVLSRVRSAAAEEMSQHPAVVARAADLVSCDHSELGDLPGQLLGHTFIVRDLSAARLVAAEISGFRLLTLQGELLEPDGTLTVGTHHATAGILARKSELHELAQQAAELDQTLGVAERELLERRDRLAALDTRIERQNEQIQVLAEQSGDLRSRVQRHHDRRQGLHEEVTVSQDEIERIEQEIAELDRAWRDAQAQAAEAEARVQTLQQRVHEADRHIRAAEDERHVRQQACTNAHVQLAKIEERVSSLGLQHDQLGSDLELGKQEVSHSEQTLTASSTRLQESERAMLEASAALAQAFLDKEMAERQISELVEERDRLRQGRTHLAQQAHVLRDEWRTRQEQFHARELEANDVRHRRDTLADRLREDYQVELAELYQQIVASGQWPVASEQPSVSTVRAEGSSQDQPESPSGHWPLATGHCALDPTAVNDEIADLRRKLSRLGSVNLEALQELNELETRAGSLRAQFDDLTAAKKSLEEIIHKINQDSRRLFSDSFQSIRTHFQELFRKLFGGGRADVVFEDENDILESGIEVIAQPPGKDLRSISLMSGGEKTLTAVALLLAVFRSKPSPFCILDEVDAALDEANIERFTAVVREFLDRSQFIIVTHSKKTMAAADVLYGITMQESGISKQVAVRFEDYPDDPPQNPQPDPDN